jgi:hypothetical protein
MCLAAILINFFKIHYRMLLQEVESNFICIVALE